MNPAAVFADTSFYIAGMRADDPAHERAMAESSINRPIITTEFVILELGNSFSRAPELRDFLRLVRLIRGNPRVVVVPLDSRLLHRGLRLMEERPDKDWSLTDCISFVVMEEEGLRDALTTDRHFEQAGFTALLR